MSRLVHFVGSLPPQLMTDDTSIMKWFLRHSDGQPLTAVPRDLDPDWVVGYLRGLSEHTDALEVARTGEFADYDDMRSYRVPRGRKLEPRDISMNRVEQIDRIMTAYELLRRDRPALAGVPLQISQPNPLDLALFVFCGAAVAPGLPTHRALVRMSTIATAIHHLPTFTEAVLKEMSDVTKTYGDDVVWQVESPIALLGMVKAEQLHIQSPVAALLSRQLAGFLAAAHAIAARTTLHLCYGDYRHKSLLTPRTLAPAVKLLNRTAESLRRHSVPLPPVHIPCGHGADAAPQDSRFYAALGRLDPQWRLIAGVASPDAPDDGRISLALFEEAAGRTAYAVATACGFGRRDVDDAARAAAATVSVAKSASDSDATATSG